MIEQEQATSDLSVEAWCEALDVSALRARGNDFIGVLDGGPDNDTLTGTAGRDRLDGGEGSDQFFGFGGDDRLFGDNGNGNVSLDHDRLYGGQGNDDFMDEFAADRAEKKNVDRLAIDSLFGKGTRLEMVIDKKNLNQQDDN